MSRVTATKSGTIATIKSPGRVPIRNLKVKFSPVQGGSGDPSPSNVRPITGWTGVNVTQEGKNLFDKTTAILDKYITGSGIIADSLWDQAITDYIPVKPGEKIRSNQVSNSNYFSAFYSEKNTDSFISYTTAANFPFTVPNGAKYIILTFPKAIIDSYQVERSVVSTPYEPHRTPTTIPVTFPSEAGTVYGGNVDLVTGTLTVDFAYAVYDGSEDEDWNVESKSQGSNFYIMTPSTWKRDTNSTTLLCNLATSSSSSFNSGNCRVTSTGNFNVYIGGVIGISTVSAFKGWLSEHNLQVVCKLITPIIYTLTPQQLSTLIGTNNIYSDADSVEVTYDLAESSEMASIRKAMAAYYNANYIGGMHIMINNAALGTNNGYYNTGLEQNTAYFIPDFFDLGYTGSKSITIKRYPKTNGASNPSLREFDSIPNAQSIDYWSMNNSEGEPRTLTIAGRYIACSVLKSGADDFFIYDNTMDRYVFKGKNVT